TRRRHVRGARPGPDRPAAARMGPAHPRPARRPGLHSARPLERCPRAARADATPCRALAADDAGRAPERAPRHEALARHEPRAPRRVTRARPAPAVLAARRARTLWHE